MTLYEVNKVIREIKRAIHDLRKQDKWIAKMYQDRLMDCLVYEDFKGLNDLYKEFYLTGLFKS